MAWGYDGSLLPSDQRTAIVCLLQYAASYPSDVLCLVALDALPSAEVSSNGFWDVRGSRIDASLDFHHRSSITPEKDVEFDKALELYIARTRSDTEHWIAF